MKKILLRKVLLFLAAFVLLYSCREEELTLTSKTPTQRNNADFFKHSGKGSAYAKNAVDYISILEAYNEENDFLKQMPDQEGMPVWDKMQVFYSEEGAGAIIPLSYDKETLTSVLFATFDPENSVKAVRNITNRQLEDMTLNRNYSQDFREGILTSFLIADHYTFGTTEFTNIPKDLFKGMKHGKDSIRLSFSTFSVEEGMGSASGKFSHVSTTCLNIYHCKNNKPISACDGCSQCVTKTCSSAYIFTDDDGDIPPPHSNPGGGGGSGGSGSYPKPPKDPCTLSPGIFYRMKPNCGDTGGGMPIMDDPCEKTKAMLENPVVKSQIDSLEKKSKTIGEKAFLYMKDNTPSALIDGGNHEVKLSSYSNYKGVYHNHTPAGTKMFSVNDILTLYSTIIKQLNPATAKEAFIGVVAHESCNCPPDNFFYHNYLLRFNGDFSQTGAIAYSTKEDIDKLEDNYYKLRIKLLRIPSLRNSPSPIADLNAQGLEQLFFGILAKMNINPDQIVLQKIDKNGTVYNINLNSDGTTTSVPCP